MSVCLSVTSQYIVIKTTKRSELVLGKQESPDLSYKNNGTSTIDRRSSLVYHTRRPVNSFVYNAMSVMLRLLLRLHVVGYSSASWRTLNIYPFSIVFRYISITNQLCSPHVYNPARSVVRQRGSHRDSATSAVRYYVVTVTSHPRYHLDTETHSSGVAAAAASRGGCRRPAPR